MAEHEIVELRDAKTITLGDRIRQDPGDIRGLAESLATVGQIQPIVLDGDLLRVGFRRWSACAWLEATGRTILNLPPGHVKTTQLRDLSPLEAAIVEFEENKRRKDFSDAEEAIAITRIRALMETDEGRGVSHRTLADRLGYSVGQVTMAIRVGEAVKKDGSKMKLLKEKSIAGAYKKLRTMEKLDDAAKRADKEVDVSKDVKGLHCGDAVKWIKGIESSSIDFIHFDPPWGIGIDEYDRNNLYGSFDDSKETGIDLYKRLIPEIHRVLAVDTFAIIWFGMQHYQTIVETLVDADFRVPAVPHIWFKENKGGSQNDPNVVELPVYEPFFVVRKGNPRIVATGRTNVLSYPLPVQRIHFAQKNEDLLVDLLERYTMSGMRCLDPTFGSGAFFVACMRLGRPFLGAELDKRKFDEAIALIKRRKLTNS